MRTHLDHLETSGTAWFMLASHGPVFNTQNLNVGLDWIGLDWIYLRTFLLLEHLAVLKNIFWISGFYILASWLYFGNKKSYGTGDLLVSEQFLRRLIGRAPRLVVINNALQICRG